MKTSKRLPFKTDDSMIQRIQTLYLLLVVIVGIVQCIIPLGGFLTADAVWCEWQFAAWRFHTGEQILSTWAMAVLLAVIPAVAFATIMLYKKRILQMRLSIFNIMLMIGYYLLYFYYYWLVKQYVVADTETIRMAAMAMGSALPMVQMILTAMALRRIWKDEVLVRSLNRLR